MVTIEKTGKMAQDKKVFQIDREQCNDDANMKKTWREKKQKAFEGIEWR